MHTRVRLPASLCSRWTPARATRGWRSCRQTPRPTPLDADARRGARAAERRGGGAEARRAPALGGARGHAGGGGGGGEADAAARRRPRRGRWRWSPRLGARTGAAGAGAHTGVPGTPALAEAIAETRRVTTERRARRARRDFAADARCARRRRRCSERCAAQKALPPVKSPRCGWRRGSSCGGDVGSVSGRFEEVLRRS